MKERLVAHCPAKINLGLRVLGRRLDGYHDIVTLFQTIDLWDTLEAVEAKGLGLAVDDPSVPSDESNLVLRAARLLQRSAVGASARGAQLRLAKKIPAGGGLGGGSSDAAGTLLALNRLWKLGLDDRALAALAAELGSDVPFFLSGGTALGCGRGEQVQSLAPIPERTVMLGFPPFGISTAAVYGALGAPLTPPNTGVTVSRLFVNLAERNDFALASNDLEGPAFTLKRELVPFRDALTSGGAEVALMSGSGSTVFGLFVAGVDVDSAAAGLRAKFPDWTLRVSRTIGSGVRIETS